MVLKISKLQSMFKNWRSGTTFDISLPLIYRVSMSQAIDSNSYKNYHIHKKYTKQVKAPLDYLIKVLGLDCEERKLCKAKCSETLLRYSNEKYAGYLRLFFRKKRKLDVSAKQKRNYYEEVEETV